MIAGSNIYPILRTLTEEGFITCRDDEESPKKYYSLTEDGLEFLNMLEKSMIDFFDLSKRLIETRGVLKNE